jgi:hypothetical protein
MEYFGIVKEQKWVECYEWKKTTFNKYIIKFQDDDEYYTINRNEKIEQALINAKIIYSLKQNNSIDKHKIVGYSSLDSDDYKLISMKDLKEIAVEMYHKGFNKATETNEKPN